MKKPTDFRLKKPTTLNVYTDYTIIVIVIIANTMLALYTRH